MILFTVKFIHGIQTMQCGLESTELSLLIGHFLNVCQLPNQSVLQAASRARMVLFFYITTKCGPVTD